MDINLTWEFPQEKKGTKVHGFQSAGIAHFSTNRDRALFRECLQNSLDATADRENSVMVEIEMKQLPANLLGSESFVAALHRSCESQYNTKEGRSQFMEVKEILSKETIPTLSLRDVNTVGAPDFIEDVTEVGDSPWVAMTNSEGYSVKQGSDSLGSFGIGKHAPFAATPLRTVLYSTCYESNNGDGELSQRFIGRSILVTHFDEDGNQHSADGYLGDECVPLRDTNIPNLFLLNICGTQIWIPGYPTEINEDGQTWEDRALNAAANNFFFAIVSKRLELMIGKNLVVEKNSLEPEGECWHRITDNRTKNYIKVATKEPIENCYIRGIGDVDLRIDIGTKDEKRDRRALALIRDPGLMLTDVSQNLGPANPNIPLDWHPFTAVVTCIPREGDWVLQECEPPSHDRLSVDEIPDTNPERRKKARSALKELKDWLYEKIGERATPSYAGMSDHASELEDIGLVIEDPNLGEALRLSPLKEVNRAPREERIRHNSELDETGEDTEVDDDEGDEQPAPEDGPGGGGNQVGTRKNNRPTSTTKTNRHELEPIFSPVLDVQGQRESHKLMVSFIPPSLNNTKKLQIALRVVGEDEQDYKITIIRAKYRGIDLQCDGNIFEIPANLVNDTRMEVNLMLNEELGYSAFWLLYKLV